MIKAGARLHHQTPRLSRQNWRYLLLLWWQAKSPAEHAAWCYNHCAPLLLLLILLLLLVR